jgi:hypothetical protein
VFFVDACREGIQLSSKTASAIQLNFKKLQSVSRFKFIKQKSSSVRLHTVFSCEANHYSYTADEEIGSVFTYSLCETLKGRKYEGSSLSNVLQTTKSIMETVSTKHKRPIQKPYIMEESIPGEMPTSLFEKGSIDSSGERSEAEKLKSSRLGTVVFVSVVAAIGLSAVVAMIVLEDKFGPCNIVGTYLCERLCQSTTQEAYVKQTGDKYEFINDVGARTMGSRTGYNHFVTDDAPGWAKLAVDSSRGCAELAFQNGSIWRWLRR